MKQKAFTEQDILEDIEERLYRGLFIGWIDLTLFYVTEDTTYIGVKIMESFEETEINYHCCIPSPPSVFLARSNRKYDLNEYVKQSILILTK